MAIVWPPSLPQKVLRNSFGESSAPNVISTDLGVGPPQTRPRGTFQKKSYSCSIRITIDQKIVFDEFYQNTTISGTQPFEFPDFYIEGVILNVKFNPESSPSVSGVGGYYVDVSFALDLQP